MHGTKNKQTASLIYILTNILTIQVDRQLTWLSDRLLLRLDGVELDLVRRRSLKISERTFQLGSWQGIGQIELSRSVSVRLGAPSLRVR